MRRKNQEIKNKKLIKEILSTSEICRIGMVDNGLSYILPFNYGYKDNCIYIHSAPEGKKIELLQKENKVCFEITQKAEIEKADKACKWETTYRSIVGYGNVEIIKDYEEKKRGLEIIMAHYGAPDKIEFESKLIEFIVILKLEISSLTAKQSINWNEKNF